MSANTFVIRSRYRQVDQVLESNSLGREIELSILLPPGYRFNVMKKYPLVLLNDGQDFEGLDLRQRLRDATREGFIEPRIVVGIHANDRRMREYGTSNIPDYKGRGDLANDYRVFVITELLPYLHSSFRIRKTRQHHAIAGHSLGGLSAFDIATRHEQIFGSVGCLSASFWWRSSYPSDSQPDADRIAIERTKRSVRAADLNYFFMAGDAEENSDRNGNGIIDVIDDTVALINTLREKGVSGKDIIYEQVPRGEHSLPTWGPVYINWMKTLPK